MVNDMINVSKISTEITKENYSSRNIDNVNHLETDFLQKIIESLADGILILSKTGSILYANKDANHICYQLNQFLNSKNLIPPNIWYLCESLIESHSLFPDKNLILSDEIDIDKSTILRIRVRWLNLDKINNSCLLVTIENRYESLKNAALAEVKQYDLTQREGEIWLLHRANYTYKEIAEQLYITINTVKKHMKNIHAKRQNLFNSIHERHFF